MNIHEALRSAGPALEAPAVRAERAVFATVALFAFALSRSDHDFTLRELRQADAAAWDFATAGIVPEEALLTPDLPVALIRLLLLDLKDEERERRAEHARLAAFDQYDDEEDNSDV